MPDIGAFRQFSALEAEPRQTTHHRRSNCVETALKNPGAAGSITVRHNNRADGQRDGV